MNCGKKKTNYRSDLLNTLKQQTIFIYFKLTLSNSGEDQHLYLKISQLCKSDF